MSDMRVRRDYIEKYIDLDKYGYDGWFIWSTVNTIKYLKLKKINIDNVYRKN